MKKNYPKIIFITFMSLLLLIVFAGCGATQRMAPDQQNVRNQMDPPGTPTTPNGDLSPGTDTMDGIKTPYEVDQTPGTNDTDLSRLGTPMSKYDLRRGNTDTTRTNNRNQGNTNATRTNDWNNGNTGTTRINDLGQGNSTITNNRNQRNTNTTRTNDWNNGNNNTTRINNWNNGNTGTTRTNNWNNGNTGTTRINNWGQGNTNTTRTNDQRGILGIPNGNNVAYDNKKAESIADILTDMEPIERATVVISGNTALVGIDLVDGYYKYSEEEYLKDELVGKIKSLAPEVTNVAISELPDVYERISRLSRDMANGNTADRMGDEFRDLVNRITSKVR